jgi:ABC-type xylose transport system permease subunit
MNPDILSILWFTVMGLLGGVANVVANSKGWEDLKEFSAFKKTVLGAVIGLLYSWLHSEYNWPNNVMSFISGYAGQDFILRLITKYQTSKEAK